VLLLHLVCYHHTAADGLCQAVCTGTGEKRKCVFEFSLDFFASETGYFKVKGCPGTMPTLAMESNVEYTFIQTDETNWMHPLGFGYFPDGAHKNVDELEPRVNPLNKACVTNSTCQHPLYFGGDAGLTFLGMSPVAETENFGLDVYEPEFKKSLQNWKKNQYNVKLTISDQSTSDIFYFCHLHDNMSGRIKVLDENGEPRSIDDKPPLGYTYQSLDSFDSACGTHDVSRYQNSSSLCPDMTFLCGVNASMTSAKKTFGECMIALDCAMHVEMRVNIQEDPIVTFIHQMIPHHRNAVNMAKVLLKHGQITDANDPDGDLVAMLWNIVNTQNEQITFMRSWLKTYNKKSTDSCQHVGPKGDPSPNAASFNLPKTIYLLIFLFFNY